MRSRFLRRRPSRGLYTGTLIVSTSASISLKYLPRCVAYSAEPEAVGRNAMRLLSRGSCAISCSSISRVSPNENSPPPMRTSRVIGRARSMWRGVMYVSSLDRLRGSEGHPGSASLFPHLFYLRAHLARRLHDVNPGIFERRHLLGGRAFAAADDRAGVAHAAARRCGLPGDERNDRLGHIRLHERRRFLLGRPADLADHDDRFGGIVLLERGQTIDEVRARQRIATDADRGRLAEVTRLTDCFVRQRSGARDDADRTGTMDVSRHDADLRLARRDDAGAVRSDETRRRLARRGVARVRLLQVVVRLDHVVDRNAFRDADDQLHPGVRGFHHRVGRERRRHEDERAIRARFFARLAHAVEDRKAFVRRAALARRHAADDLRAVVAALNRVKGSFTSGDALNDDFGVLVCPDRHLIDLSPLRHPERSRGTWGAVARSSCRHPFPGPSTTLGMTSCVLSLCLCQDGLAVFAASTTFCAASHIPSAVMSGRPESLRICLPRSTFVPSRRTTTGTGSPTSREALTTPSAIRSPRMMPPKILIRIAFTFLSLRMMRNAFLTCSALAPPPTSRKFAGSPPASLTMSIVAIARPAPLTMQRPLPSSLM